MSIEPGSRPESTQLSPLAQPEPWNDVAAGYDTSSRQLMEKYSRAALALLERDRPFSSETRLLDVACGPGTATLLCAARVGSIDAVDFSPNMLRALSANLDRLGQKNVTIHNKDGQSLPFDPSTFDVAVSMFGVIFFPDRLRGMKEICRVLRPGGRAVISSWAPMSRSSLMQAMLTAVAAVDPNRAPAQPDPTSLENPEVFRSEMTQAGFSDVQVEAVEESAEFESAAAFWDAMAQGAVPLSMLKKQLGQEVFESRSIQAQEKLKETFSWPASLSSTAYLAHGKKG